MKKNIVKIILDIIMIVTLSLLYNSHVAAMSFHEIAGIGLFVLFAIHCLLNVKWITAISKRFFSKSLSLKIRINYIINLLLAITFILIIISGISTSQVLFPTDNKDSVWRGIHHFCAAVSIILVGIHLGLHWPFICKMVEKVVRINTKIIKKVIAIALLLVVISFGIYSVTLTNFTAWLTEPFVTQTKSADADVDAKKDSSTPDAEKSKEGNMNNHPSKDGEKKHDNSSKKVDLSLTSVLLTISQFISIIGLFAAISYYLEKLLTRKQNKE